MIQRRNVWGAARYAIWWLCVVSGIVSLGGCAARPSAAEQRRTEIRRNDSLEWVQAKADLAVADSVATFRAFELEDLKHHFVFEKKEKYQTMGYYVPANYQGDKSRFSFFPEVEENGKLLLVSIDRKRQYSFTEIRLGDEDFQSQLPENLSDAVRRDIDQCRVLAQAMQELTHAERQREKLMLKVRFYERKLDMIRRDDTLDVGHGVDGGVK